MRFASFLIGSVLGVVPGLAAQFSAPESAPLPIRPLPLFNGQTLDGWEGDPKLWRVEDGVLVGGSLTHTLPQNEFLATTRRFTNFVFRAQFKLVGTGFVNSGVQLRSERVPGSSEMAGYQCDIGDPNWWGSLYDESRRNRVLAWSDLARIEPTLRRGDWNDYVIRADGRRLTTWINGVLGVDYFEPDPDIIGSGRIGFQVHGGGAAQASFRNISIDLLPDRPAVVGALPPPAPSRPSPLSPEEQQQTFSLPPGFVAELVAAEPEGGKFVALNFDHAGRLWTMTALEYPLDANEAGEEARALFARGGRDRVLVFDTPTAPGLQQARTFAQGLVMPLGVLPYQRGALVQYGSEIRFYSDANQDGVAEGFTNVLTGFGIEDSHLFPHQFTRAPGGWLWLAQGAFNSSQVKTTDGKVTVFNRTKMARWRPDGSEFEIIGWGPCNIWGLVLDRHGESFIQEANDQGWPLMPFLEGASYPGCGDDVPRPFAPPFPKTGEKEMGGTGLSGLAYSEGSDSFPAPWRDVFFLNNPITRKVQAIRVHRTEHRTGVDLGPNDWTNGWTLEHLPDFVLSSDPWFRPVAMTFGPDGCLYVVDWYNQIISHNEVPRKHPERDKTRGRIWRFRHESQPHRLTVPNLYAVPAEQLLIHLRATNTWEVNAAWEEIVDRSATQLTPQLTAWLRDSAPPVDVRIRALWSLEGLGTLTPELVESLESSPARSLRKESLRAAAGMPPTAWPDLCLEALAERRLEDPDRLVRQEAIRVLVSQLRRTNLPPATRATWVGLLVRAHLKSPPGGPRFGPYFNQFETYLIRRALEQNPESLTAWLKSFEGQVPESKRDEYAFGALSLGGVDGARRFASVWGKLQRSPTSEEILLLASAASDSQVKDVWSGLLSRPETLRRLYELRAQVRNAADLAPELTAALKTLVIQDPSPANRDLLVQLATGFRLAGLETELVAAATQTGASPEVQLAALRALRESGSTRVEVLQQFARSGEPAVRREAVTALAQARSEDAVPALVQLWPNLTPALRKLALEGLTGSPARARQLLVAVTQGAIAREELDGYTLDKLAAVLPDDPVLKQIREELSTTLRPVLRLNGGDEDGVESSFNLEGPFTLESWVKLDPGMGNQDSLLGSPNQFDANFFGGQFRVWLGGGRNDVVVATKPFVPESWTHLAVTRDAEGVYRIYWNGELDATSAPGESRPFTRLAIGRSTAPGGTAGELAEYRLWQVCRSAEQIRATANLELPATTPGLLYSGRGDTWGTLSGQARLEQTSDLPPLVSQAEAQSLEAKFSTFRSMASQTGDAARGREVFATTCGLCHPVRGSGGRIGPALDGAGVHGSEALLRNILTPNAAMEAGYRRFRVETLAGEVWEGLLAGEDAQSVTLRQPNAEDQRFDRAALKRAGFVKGSVMPEGLLESLPPDQARDLLAYLLTLK